MNMRFGTWYVRSMYRTGSLRAATEEISKSKLDLVGVHKVRWDGGGTNQQANVHFSMERGMRIMN
jgi:hypothetical protein